MATLIITIPDDQVARIQAAVGKQLMLPGPATNAQVKQFVINHLKETVLWIEKNAAYDAATASTNAAILAATLPAPDLT